MAGVSVLTAASCRNILGANDCVRTFRRWIVNAAPGEEFAAEGVSTSTEKQEVGGMMKISFDV